MPVVHYLVSRQTDHPVAQYNMEHFMCKASYFVGEKSSTTEIRLVTCKKCRTQYYKHLKQLPLPFDDTPSTSAESGALVEQGNAEFQRRRAELKDFIYVGKYIVAEWYSVPNGMGERKIRIRRPDEPYALLLRLEDEAEAVHICISITDHQGDFGAAKESGWKTGDDLRYDEYLKLQALGQNHTRREAPKELKSNGS